MRKNNLDKDTSSDFWNTVFLFGLSIVAIIILGMTFWLLNTYPVESQVFVPVW